MQNRGLILINAFNKNEHALHSAHRLSDELAARGIAIEVRRNDAFAAKIDEDGSIASCAAEFDFCVYLDKDKYVSHMLEKAGMRLFDTHKAIRACDDKMTTAICLAGLGIPMPKTLASPLCYDRDAVVSEAMLDRIEAELGYPIVVKTCFGSLGQGVFKADTRAQLRELADTLRTELHLFQQAIVPSFGHDLRAILVGGKPVAAMERTAARGEFRSNLELGGTARAVTLPPAIREACEKAASALGLDYCGIDVLTDGDRFWICEVNSNAFFGGIERVCGVNVAGAYADHIVRTIYGR